jgi:hypothetical protein
VTKPLCYRTLDANKAAADVDLEIIGNTAVAALGYDGVATLELE